MQLGACCGSISVSVSHSTKNVSLGAIVRSSVRDFFSNLRYSLELSSLLLVDKPAALKVSVTLRTNSRSEVTKEGRVVVFKCRALANHRDSISIAALTGVLLRRYIHSSVIMVCPGSPEDSVGPFYAALLGVTHTHHPTERSSRIRLARVTY